MDWMFYHLWEYLTIKLNAEALQHVPRTEDNDSMFFLLDVVKQQGEKMRITID